VFDRMLKRHIRQLRLYFPQGVEMALACTDPIAREGTVLVRDPSGVIQDIKPHRYLLWWETGVGKVTFTFYGGRLALGRSVNIIVIGRRGSGSMLGSDMGFGMVSGAGSGMGHMGVQGP